MIRCIIVEDEPLAASKLAEYIKKVDLLDLQSVFDNAIDAMSYLKSNTVDLVFLDICMDNFDGMQLLKSLTHYPKIIITSAESRYALESYEYRVSDYLLKPFSFDRLIKSVSKVADEIAKEQSADAAFIFVKTEYRTERVDLGEIRYIEGMRDYLCIVVDHHRIMTLMSFDDILKLLPSSRFARVHRSFIVSLNKVRNIEKSRIRIEDAIIPISETYKDQFLALLKRNNHIL